MTETKRDDETQTEFTVRLIRAEAWDEGFDAGERDVWNHEQAGWRNDDPCVTNPYRDTPATRRETEPETDQPEEES